MRARGLWGTEADLSREEQVLWKQRVAEGFSQPAGEVLGGAKGFGKKEVGV